MAENKVKFNLKNVHIAPITSEGEYGTIFALPGAVSLTLSASGDLTKYYADGLIYYQSASNNGYEGDLEIALVTDKFRQEILNETLDTNKVMFEDATNSANDFALGFQIDGDKNDTMFWYYNCSVTRPSTEAKTTEGSVEPASDKLTLSCVPNEDGIVRAKTTAETTASVKTNWFSTVYTKTATA